MRFSDFIKICERDSISLPEAILRMEMEESGISIEKLRENIEQVLEIMMKEVEIKYGKRQKTLTGMTGFNAQLMNKYAPQMMGEFNHMAMVAALSMAESNAAMGRIVACPTAGACGVIPGVLFALKKIKEASHEALLNDFIVAGGIGWVISRNASLSGAEGGCQAEIGAATAMAAGAMAYHFSGDAKKCEQAAALALKSMMGLVCDPVGGFVEVPCVKRNGIATQIAIGAAEMSLAGVESVIPFDEVVDAMRRVGYSLPESLRETGRGGIATTPTARKLVERIKGNNV